MKSLFIGEANSLTLDSAITEAVTSGSTVTASVMDEGGIIIDDNSGNPQEAIPCDFDGTAKKYGFTFTPDETLNSGYLRVYWHIEGATLEDTFTPENYLLSQANPEQSTGEIVPVDVFLGDYIAAASKLDDDYVDAVNSYVTNNRIAIINKLLAAQGNIERELKIKMFKFQDAVSRDFYMQEFNSEFWYNQTDWKPIISLDEFKLSYGQQNFPLSMDLTKYMLVDYKSGTIEFLPTVSPGELYSALITGVSAIGISIIARATANRIPLLFRIKYTTGLDFPNQDPATKESFRNAICRNALLNLLPIIDPMVRNPSESLAIDGVSRSASSGLRDLLKTYQDQEERWLRQTMKEYGTATDFVVI